MEQRSRTPAIGAMAALAAAVGGWWFWWWYGASIVAQHWKQEAPQGLDSLGQAGDLFGGFSALFSALAFVGVVIAAYLQRETIKLQRQEMLRAEKEACEARIRAEREGMRTSAAHARQAFEPLFFQLVELLRSQSKGMQLVMGDIASSTRHFDAALAGLREDSQIYWDRAVGEQTLPEGLKWLSDAYDGFYARNESQLGPYLRTLYHTLKLIDRSDLSDDEKVDYANILRGLLSRDELLLVMLNCLSGWGAGLKRFIEKYGVLKHITRSDTTPTMDEGIARLAFEPTATMAYAARREHWAANGSAQAA